jgi:hypothetical protein
MKLKNKNGILYPAKMKTRSWIVTGTPGSGKSYMINRIGGWPGEIGVDIAMRKWWAVEPLTHRPREVHFAFPFEGLDKSYPVYDEIWQKYQKYPDVDWSRIRIPQKKRFILAPNWRARFVFDFILSPPAWIKKQRVKRYASLDKRPMDANLSEQWIKWQAHVYWNTAWYFYNSGLQVIVRPFNTVRPYSFPVLKKIMRKKGRIRKKEMTPDIDFTKVKNVRTWVSQSAPGDLIKQLVKS